ncbi:helix-hairpin-helix domain-containing protein [Floridanema aerugineum]|jgi:DNA uptake protein ComE-like DNA-binding protein|uniref:Helix-hairpin-helix domain-containing protein n=1 Tax=Floridaenema aerugineum BLCC-F46 TaxID=3153654 RepID=A0ABV4XDB9_9CYAN
MFIRNRLLKDPYYRFGSLEEVVLAASLGIRIDVNQATVDDWLRLPGLSIHQARSLVELSRNGVQFHCLEDIAAALSWSVQRLQPLAPILQFCYYDVESIYSPKLINPNTATGEMLSKIPGIDSSLADRIVANRESAGFYRNLADFQNRLSLPGEVIGQLMHHLCF